MVDENRPEGRPRQTERARWVKLAVAVLAGVAALVGGIFAAGALFTSQATVAGQQVGTATVEIAADTVASSAPIDVDSLLPGDSESTVIEVANTGNEDVYYAVSLKTTEGGDEALEEVLQVTVEVGEQSQTQTVADWPSGVFQLGDPLSAGATQEVEVSIQFPENADNELQGLSTEFSIQVEAIQARNVPEPTPGWVVD
ncbi:hypothetical protein BHE97_11460 [Aeromicrobium sp. PE09-221]|nr:hypothetical protein BHE97_11460 [Aeromicrobium sp. PE09-221]